MLSSLSSSADSDGVDDGTTDEETNLDEEWNRLNETPVFGDLLRPSSFPLYVFTVD